ERYGMTETLIITSTRPGEPARPGYVGRPLPGVSVRVSDEQGTEVAHDDEAVGSVWVHGPSVFERYASGTRTLRDGWFETGDLAAVTGDGALRLVGRSSTDLIKSGGYRMAAGEIEAALLTHPAVGEAAVRGLPDAELGERVVAWVVLADGRSASDGELIDHVARQLTAHKRPREIRRVASLPRNELGKVRKQLLA
ncbi:MAG TPA: AMP-binding protein, partial [Solirubrobacteraceae bacterium]|nr:AMP-binding protein [Solirubrobacteraceae bacterium]